MAKVILVLATLGITIYAFIDCLRSADSEIQALPKPLWLLVIVLTAPFGATMWLLFGRSPGPDRSSAAGRRRVLAPDDDPDFLRSLDPPRTRDGERRRTDGEDDEGDPPPV